MKQSQASFFAFEDPRALKGVMSRENLLLVISSGKFFESDV